MNSDVMSFDALAPAFPELMLAGGAIVLLLLGVLFRRDRYGLISGAAIALALIAFGAGAHVPHR